MLHLLQREQWEVGMTYSIVEHDGHVEIEGVTRAEMVEALQLFDAARSFQSKKSADYRHSLVAVMSEARVDQVPAASLDQARRLVQLRASLLATPHFTNETLAELRGDEKVSTTRTWLSRQRTSRKLFTVRERGRTIVPGFQFRDSGSLRAELAPLLEVLGNANVSEWEMWIWLTSGTPLLSGSTPSDVATVEPARALGAAKRFAARR